MRTKKVPDHYVGDRHLTNWFIKHLGMNDLSMAYKAPEAIRGTLTSKTMGAMEGEFILVFKCGRTIKMFSTHLHIRELT